MKQTSVFFGLCLAMTVMVISSQLVQADFLIDIHINSAEAPSLSFGEVDAPVIPTRSPFPPYSGMFGVIDVCFAGEENAEEWYDRLSEDIKASSPSNQWILVAKSNARLMFKLSDGSMPNNLKIVYKDAKTNEKKIVPIENELSFSVKTGGVYTLTRDDTADPAENPNSGNNQFVPKGESGVVTITPTAFTPKTINISFAAGMEILAYDGENLAARGITLADVDWTIKVVYDGTVVYSWTVPYTELQITLTPNGTRADGDLNITMTPSRSAKPVSTTLEFLDDQDDVKLTKVVDWILQTFGTLDFDGDGFIDSDDVQLFFNYVSVEGPTDIAIIQGDDGKAILVHRADVSNIGVENAQTLFLSVPDDLDFDDDGSIDSDDVQMLFNYVSVEGPSDPTIVDGEDGLAILMHRADVTKEGAEAARDFFQSMSK